MTSKKQSKTPGKKLSVDQRFFKNLMQCLDAEEKICIQQSKLLKKRKACIQKGIDMCANVVDGVYELRSTRGRKGEKIHFKYHSQTRRAAQSFLKKFAVKVGT